MQFIKHGTLKYAIGLENQTFFQADGAWGGGGAGGGGWGCLLGSCSKKWKCECWLKR